MRIYLTKYSTLSTEALHLVEDHAYPQRAHFFPELFKATKSGLFCTYSHLQGVGVVLFSGLNHVE